MGIIWDVPPYTKRPLTSQGKKEVSVSGTLTKQQKAGRTGVQPGKGLKLACNFHIQMPPKLGPGQNSEQNIRDWGFGGRMVCTTTKLPIAAVRFRGGKRRVWQHKAASGMEGAPACRVRFKVIAAEAPAFPDCPTPQDSTCDGLR